MAIDPRHVEALYRIAHQIQATTAFVDQIQATEEGLLTSTDLARQLGIPHEVVKKLLKILKEAGLIRAMGLSPKRFRFDAYQFRQLSASVLDDASLQAVVDRLQGVASDPLPR